MQINKTGTKNSDMFDLKFIGFKLSLSRIPLIKWLGAKAHMFKVLRYLVIALLLAGLFPGVGQPVYGAYTAMDISYTLGNDTGLQAGGDALLRAEITNIGEIAFRTIVVSLTLPSGVTPKGGSVTETITGLSPGDKGVINFPLVLSGDMDSKPYSFTIQASGTGYAGESSSASKTFYIPVGGGGASLKSLSVSNLKFPQEIPAGQSFQVDFDVQNGGGATMSDVRVQTEIPEGLYLQGMGDFTDSFAKGEKKHYTIRLFSLDTAAAKGYPIKISLSAQPKADSPKQVQYATVVLTAGPGGAVKNPLIMVDSYSYGGSSV